MPKRERRRKQNLSPSFVKQFAEPASRATERSREGQRMDLGTNREYLAHPLYPRLALLLTHVVAIPSPVEFFLG